MNSIDEPHVSQPLFASMSSGFGQLSDSVKSRLGELGGRIWDRAHKGDISDKPTQLHVADFESGNIDVIYKAAQMVNISKPVLKPGTMEPLMKIIRNHCVLVFQGPIISLRKHEVAKAKQSKEKRDRSRYRRTRVASGPGKEDEPSGEAEKNKPNRRE